LSFIGLISCRLLMFLSVIAVRSSSF